MTYASRSGLLMSTAAVSSDRSACSMKSVLVTDSSMAKAPPSLPEGEETVSPPSEG